MEVTLTMDEEIAEILMHATEYYSRIFCGQYSIMPNEMVNIRRSYIIEKEGEEVWDQISLEEYKKCRITEEALFQAFHIQFPELARNSHWGLGYSRETDIAFNIYQAVRYALSWYRHPEGGSGVNFNTPSADDRPIPRVEINGKRYIKENVDLSISCAVDNICSR